MLDNQLERLENKIAEKLESYRAQFELLKTIPGIKEANATAILAEIGPNMDQFETAENLCSWAGICPGNNRSAGKSKSSHIKRANKFLLASLVEASWGAVHKRESGFRRKYHRWSNKLGQNKSNIAVAHSVLRVVHAILKSGQPYREPDPEVVHEMERQKSIRIHAKKLQKLGANQATIDQIVKGLLAQVPPPLPPPETPSEPSQPPQAKAPSKTGEKIRRGALGIRVFHLSDMYSVEKDQEAAQNNLIEPNRRIKSGSEPLRN